MVAIEAWLHRPEQNANVVGWRHDCRAQLGSRDADPKILACLTDVTVDHIAPHDAVGVCNDLSLLPQRPSFEDDHLVELLPLGLVHVHYDYAAFDL